MREGKQRTANVTQHRLKADHPWYVVQLLLRRFEKSETISLKEFPSRRTGIRMCRHAHLLEQRRLQNFE